ncbi:hypothetical protein G5714_005346 [Onychostoma macrolepis]|uniref:G-protein coupled receptors family 1 profile domain-containing protein n=1 Tax=Onychostoma macrolepis TaxID=369639 RepID=A0A7J6D0S3_9TELE|nr:hypothetical protein G5714_005346 [Onychostoma macrolepis]
MKTRMRFGEKSLNAFYFHIQFAVLADRHTFLIFFTLLFCCQRLYKMSGEDSAIDYDAIITELKSIQPINVSENITKPIQHEIRMIYLITYSVVLILGVTLNFIVIVISCLKNKKSSTVAIWITALALTHLISSAFNVFQLLYAHNDFEWNYGKASCKLSSYITYGSMFSTAAMLSLWSISFAFSKMFSTPVAQHPSNPIDDTQFEEWMDDPDHSNQLMLPIHRWGCIWLDYRLAVASQFLPCVVRFSGCSKEGTSGGLPKISKEKEASTSNSTEDTFHSTPQQSDSTYEEHDMGDHGEELRTLQDTLANHKQDIINLKLQLEAKDGQLHHLQKELQDALEEGHTDATGAHSVQVFDMVHVS